MLADGEEKSPPICSTSQEIPATISVKKPSTRPTTSRTRAAIKKTTNHIAKYIPYTSQTTPESSRLSAQGSHRRNGLRWLLQPSRKIAFARSAILFRPIMQFGKLLQKLLKCTLADLRTEPAHFC